MGRFQYGWSGRALTLLAAFAAAGVGVSAFSSCSDPLPAYPVAYPTLRLVPAQSSVDDSGGPIFVLVELQLEAPGTGGASIGGAHAGTGGIGGAGTTHHMVFVSVSGASIQALPGPSLCQSASGSTGSTGSGGSTSSTSGGGATSSSGVMSGGASSGSSSSSATLTLTEFNLYADPSFGARTGGFVAVVPQGTTPIELVATAYTYVGPSSACTLSEPDVSAPKLVAVGTATIDRASIDAGGSGGKNGTGTGGHGTGGHGTGGHGTGGGTGGHGTGGAGSGGGAGGKGAGTGGAPGKDGG